MTILAIISTIILIAYVIYLAKDHLRFGNKEDALIYRKLNKFQWDEFYSHDDMNRHPNRVNLIYASSCGNYFITLKITNSIKTQSRTYELYKKHEGVNFINFINLEQSCQRIINSFDDGIGGVKQIVRDRYNKKLKESSRQQKIRDQEKLGQALREIN